MKATSTRLLAGLAIALGGLFALKALNLTDEAAQLLSAAPPVVAAAKSDEDTAHQAANAGEEDADAYAQDEAGIVDAAAPIECEPSRPSFSDRAGISASEIDVLTNLNRRRQELDAREQDILLREGLLLTAETQVETRIAELKEIEASIADMLGQLDAVEEARLSSLVNMYGRMKPKDAARIMTGLDEPVLLDVAAQMPDTKLADILAEMPDQAARDLTVALANRHANKSAAALAALQGEEAREASGDQG